MDYKDFNKFIDQVLKSCDDRRVSDKPLFRVAKELSNKKNGLYLEFGVYRGFTINNVSNILQSWDIYGFDSFEGLPEFWRPGYDRGFFSTNGLLPHVNSSVKLIKGLFDDTLPYWCANNKYNNIDILHIDCDIYSSTKTIFKHCNKIINYNTIIVFDELINYPSFEDHEIKALYEYTQYYNLDISIICANGENVALKIKNKT